MIVRWAGDLWLCMSMKELIKLQSVLIHSRVMSVPERSSMENP